MNKLLPLLVLVVALPAWASAPKTPQHWQTPAAWSQQTRARYQNLVESFRCPICQGESIAASGSGLAADLRKQVRQMMKEGKTDQQIRQYMVARYGDYILYDPPFQPSTWLLWVGPFVLVLIGLAVVVIFARRSPRVVETDPETLEKSRRLLDLNRHSKS